MFLYRLDKEEKIGFLELAHYVARCDEAFTESQKELIGAYCAEMQIEDIEFDIEKFDIYNTLGKITNKTSQKIVLLEIMALVYSDSFFHEEEREVIEDILEEFNLNHHLVTIYGEWAKAISSLYAQGNALIEL